MSREQLLKLYVVIVTFKFKFTFKWFDCTQYSYLSPEASLALERFTTVVVKEPGKFTLTAASVDTEAGGPLASGICHEHLFILHYDYEVRKCFNNHVESKQKVKVDTETGVVRYSSTVSIRESVLFLVVYKSQLTRVDPRLESGGISLWCVLFFLFIFSIPCR